MYVRIEYIAITIARLSWLLQGYIWWGVARLTKDPYQRFQYEMRSADNFVLFHEGQNILPPDLRRQIVLCVSATGSFFLVLVTRDILKLLVG